MTTRSAADSQLGLLHRQSTRDAIMRGMSFVLLVVLSIFFLTPFFWMISTAFKDPSLIYRRDPVWIPPEITLRNFREALDLVHPSFLKLIANSTIVTGLSVIGNVLSSSVVGFAFAALPANRKNLIFTLVLSTLMLPAQVVLIPQFIMFSRIGWRDTWWPLIAPSFFAYPFYVFLFKQFFTSIPKDLYDSAELDGCSPLGIYWRIAMPLSKPAIATAAVFTFLWVWNDLLKPLVFLSDSDKYTLTLGLAAFQSGMMDTTPVQHLMALSLLGLLPPLLIFFLGMRFFVQGIATTGLKG